MYIYVYRHSRFYLLSEGNVVKKKSHAVAESEVGGSESATRQSPCNREIVSFRPGVRRAVSGCEEGSQCKNEAGPLSLFA